MLIPGSLGPGFSPAKLPTAGTESFSGLFFARFYSTFLPKFRYLFLYFYSLIELLNELRI